MPNTVFILGIALVVVFLVLRLLRNRRLREKYAALWVVVGLATLGLGLFPGLLDGAADLLGFEVGSNLLFLLAVLLLLSVTLHLSLEISVMEDETRVLAEEAAIGRLQIEELRARLEDLEGRRPASAEPFPAAPPVDQDRDVWAQVGDDRREPGRAGPGSSVRGRQVSGPQDVLRERPQG